MDAGIISGPAPPAIRVASIPAAHPYVAGLGLDAAGVTVLPDPPVPGAPAGQWWPPAMLDRGWILRHRDAFDLMHLHFGAESLSANALAAVLAALRGAGRPLAHTVHDLSHPQLGSQKRHREQLDVLVPAADVLITLTETAADEIEARWGRRPVVLAHPAMLGGALPPVPADRRPPVVGVHLRDLRPNIDGEGTVQALLTAAAWLRTHGSPVRVEVFLHTTVRDEPQADRIRELLSGVGTADGQLVLRTRPGDAELRQELACLAVSVLPYGHGTHSGWLELCWDLGVPVAVPNIGHFAAQHPGDAGCETFRRADPVSLATTLASLLARPLARPGSEVRSHAQEVRAQARQAARHKLGRAHAELYRQAIRRGPR